ncbi:hypothetical protein KOR42_18580 [Thalassoglobus neptunius]|uniref:Zinc-finger domain-containing protein n=1 Tax=Thalassoglobus neptunius TaxID=1938619 RepID=A0A5C5X863_9PLAN|nr:hypothetical protein [Thalassoglobus neptunius]TWT58483.1 hypothetical protein KOR42_18580 [Thalassoglobus neptunius]
MTFVYSPEMLSAYLDGELTDAEKQFLEELLQKSPELQAELDEIKNVSLRVQEVPRLSAPSDLQSQILDAVKSHSTGVNKAQTASPKRSKVTWIASSIAACLGIGVTVWMLQRDQIPTDSLASRLPPTMIESKELATTPTTESSFNSTISLQTDTLESSRNFTASTMESLSNGVSNSLQLADQPSPAFTESDGISPIEELSTLAGVFPTEPQQPTPTVVSLSANDLAQRLKTLTDIPDRGEDLSVATVHAGTPIIVDFTVVDIQKTLGDVEILVKSQTPRPADIQNIAINTQNADDQQFTVVILDLEEPTLENILNSVEAVSAVMYVEEDASELLRETNLGVVADDLARHSGISSAVTDAQTPDLSDSYSQSAEEAAELMFSASPTSRFDVNPGSAGLEAEDYPNEYENRSVSQNVGQPARRFHFDLSAQRGVSEGIVSRGLVLEGSAQGGGFVVPAVTPSSSGTESALSQTVDADQPSDQEPFGVTAARPDSFELKASATSSQGLELNAAGNGQRRLALPAISPKSGEPLNRVKTVNSGASSQINDGVAPPPTLTTRQQEQKIRAFLLLRELPE